MYNYNKKLNLILKKKYNIITQNNKYIVVCKYNNILLNKFYNLKYFLNYNNIKYKTIKQTIFNDKYNLKGHGSLFILYFNNYKNLKNLIKFLENNENIYPIKILYKNNEISILKLNKILKKEKNIVYVFKNSINRLYNIITKIKKTASIT